LLRNIGSAGLSHLPPSERTSWPRLDVNVDDVHTGTTVPVRAVIGCRSLSAWLRGLDSQISKVRPESSVSRSWSGFTNSLGVWSLQGMNECVVY
jgi:hypothetical protein